MEAKQLLLEKTKLTEEFDDINISVTKLLTDMGNASEIKSIADKCLKATKNEFSKQVETFTIYENSTLSLHESVKALMAECEQLNEDLKTKENASENMKQKIEEAQKSIAEIDNELHQYIKLRQKRKYDSDGVPENSETELEKLKKKNEILHLLSGMQIFEFEDKYEGVLIGRYNERMKCFDCPKQQDPKLSTTNLLWDNIREFYSQGGMAEWSKALRLGRSLLRKEIICALNSHNFELSIPDTVNSSFTSLTLVETCFNNQFTQIRRVVLFFRVHFDLIIQFSRLNFKNTVKGYCSRNIAITACSESMENYKKYLIFFRNNINNNKNVIGPQGDEKFSDQYSKLILFADNLKEMIELVKGVVQNSKKHRKNPHMLPSLTDDEIFKLSKSLKQLSSTMKHDGAKNSVDKAHEMFAELSEQNLNYLKQVSIKAIVKMENYFDDHLPLIKNVKTKVDVLFSSYNRENDKYEALKLKFEQATEGGKLVKADAKMKEVERRLKQVKETYHKELQKSYELLDNFSNYENEVMEALRMLIKYRLEFHENALKIFKQQ
ncbi:hypothetical protein T01_8752 [Trichinella spiralis]|uniref:BAR domain-containing protein n=1 Tax=Trichinella spiralis TaxID=6334 RepID=A0A0V1BDK1_TRISP|nr:hypothetical protein T01_8752 [Trichinella spiralis]